jgi:glyoxylase-like metal-dependent hydrolase (beta-lactamase superfamily II)
MTTYPIFLLDGPKPVLFEAGVCCAGNIYVESIRAILGNRQPEALFLTHVHWDHCGAASHLKDAFPSLKIAASDQGAAILKRPNALALIKKLNENIISEMSAVPGFDSSLLIDESFRKFEVDIELKDNYIMDLGEGSTVEVLATPGHTRDQLSYYLRKEKILIGGEAAGLLLRSGIVTTEFVSNYDAYLSSLQRLAALPIEIYCQGHQLVLVGREEISAFFERSNNETIRFKDRVFELLNEEGGSIDRTIHRLKTERYDVIPGPKQPEATYLLNLKGQVLNLAAKMRRDNFAT